MNTRPINRTSEQKKTIIICIDFGHHGSSFSFTFRDLDNPNQYIDRINYNSWPSGNAKCRTALVYANENGHLRVHRWGDEAIEFEIEDEEDRSKYVLIEYFKTYFKKEDTKVMVNEKRYSVHKLMIDYLGCLYDYIEYKFSTQDEFNAYNINNDVCWVFTYPASWKQEELEKYSKILEQAGFPILGDKKKYGYTYLFVSEPEAAAINAIQDSTNTINPEEICLVIDIGGGTSDVTLLKKTRAQVFKNLSVERAINQAGNKLNKNFFKYMCKKYPDCEFEKLDSFEYKEFLSAFEEAKQRINSYSEQKINMSRCIAMKLKNLYPHAISGKRKIILSPEDIKSIYEPVINKICGMASVMISEVPRSNRPKHCIFTGGTAESKCITEEIKKQFSHLNCAVADKPSFSVLRGGIYCGLDPGLVIVRKSKWSIGLSTWDEFDPEVSVPEEKVQDIDGRWYVVDRFYPLVEYNEEVYNDEEREYPFNIMPNSDKIEIDIYRCVDKVVPFFTDDNRLTTIVHNLSVIVDQNQTGTLHSITLYTKVGGNFLEYRVVDNFGNELGNDRVKIELR